MFKRNIDIRLDSTAREEYEGALLIRDLPAAILFRHFLG
jgi:hypothetical protein